MEIRQATEADVESIEEVARETWEADYPDILHRETIDEDVEEWYNDDQIETELEEEDAILLVAETDGEVVGFTHAVRKRRTGYILRVYVAPDHREEGVGSELLTSARDMLLTRGVDDVQAMVLAENEPGNAFYESFGFEKVGEEETVIGGDTYTENVYERRR